MLEARARGGGAAPPEVEKVLLGVAEALGGVLGGNAPAAVRCAALEALLWAQVRAQRPDPAAAGFQCPVLSPNGQYWGLA